MKNLKKPAKSQLLNLLMLLCVIGIVISAAILIVENREYAKSGQAYQQLRGAMEANAVQAEQTKPESPADQKKIPRKRAN